MFPENITDDETSTSTTQYDIISDSEYIRKTPNYDYNEKDFIVKSGNINLADDYQNVRNWIIKFLTTPIDTYKIYEGTGFGTSAYKLKGYKAISGLLFAQIKKEIEDGFKLNPNIIQVLETNIYKEENNLVIYVKCKLQDGYILEEKTETYILK